MSRAAPLMKTATLQPEQPTQVNHAMRDGTTASKIMIVDDEAVNIKVARRYLQLGGYTNFVTTTEATAALDTLNRERPDVVLLDIMMPGMSGLDILAALRRQDYAQHLPVIVLTASTDAKTRTKALDLGATDFLAKPVDGSELIPRVRNALVVKAYHDYLTDQTSLLEQKVQERTMELANSRLELLHCLARAAEYRDSDTGMHVIRVGQYAGIIARQLGLKPTHVTLIAQAAPLHDVGKIGIPDAVLLKPGKLTAEEMDTMKTHCAMGHAVFDRIPAQNWAAWQVMPEQANALACGRRSSLLETAARIALSHHERWDGTGYPNGLRREDIPIEGRITSVADVFDALSTKRPYKQPYPIARCMEIIREGRGTQFDPNVVDAFMACRDEILSVFTELMDTTQAMPQPPALET